MGGEGADSLEGCIWSAASIPLWPGGSLDLVCTLDVVPIPMRLRVCSDFHIANMQRLPKMEPLINVEGIDAKSGNTLGVVKVRLLEGGRVCVSALEKSFNASTLLIDSPNGVLMDANSAGHSNCTFLPDSTVKVYRRQPADFEQPSSQLEFSWPNFLRFHHQAQGTWVLCICTWGAAFVRATLLTMMRSPAGPTKKGN